ncbi:hypothetical protein MSG28_001826 [Choristoneura fumiferana]|uniref:Uncharacterized protein n=1 Tax=Choristoneura fumiferana TaxID=7141 RepID=A0ACC0KWC9_CHOFU|nr:hypothetical protein MSG28_001826 [Choristoneura fumiferana]
MFVIVLARDQHVVQQAQHAVQPGQQPLHGALKDGRLTPNRTNVKQLTVVGVAFVSGPCFYLGGVGGRGPRARTLNALGELDGFGQRELCNILRVQLLFFETGPHSHHEAIAERFFDVAEPAVRGQTAQPRRPLRMRLAGLLYRREEVVTLPEPYSFWCEMTLFLHPGSDPLNLNFTPSECKFSLTPGDVMSFTLYPFLLNQHPRMLMKLQSLPHRPDAITPRSQPSQLSPNLRPCRTFLNPRTVFTSEVKMSSRSRRKRARSPSSSSSLSSESSSEARTPSPPPRKKRRKVPDAEGEFVSTSNAISLNNMIPEFDPVKDNVDAWLNIIESYTKTFAWSDRMTRYQALNKLKGSAKTYEAPNEAANGTQNGRSREYEALDPIDSWESEN